MSNQESQSPNLPKVLGTGLLLVPSIGIPILFGFVAFKALGLVANAAGFAFNQAKNVLPGQK